MNKRNEFSHCVLAGFTFLLPIGLFIAIVLYVHEKFALATRDIFVPIYKKLGLYEKLSRQVMAIGGEIVTLLVVVLVLAVVGWIVLRVLRRRRVKMFHQCLENLPVVKTVFTPIKQAVDSMFGSGLNDDHRKVVEFPYPNNPYKAIGIVMDESGDEYVVVMPLTMSAGTGVLLRMPKSAAKVIPVDVAIALQHVISCGMVKLPVKVKSSKEKGRDEKCVTGIDQFWEAIRMKNPSIKIKMSEGVRNALPDNKDEWLNFACNVIYGRVNYKINKTYNNRMGVLSLKKMERSIGRIVLTKLIYSKNLKKYKCEVKEDCIHLSLDDNR